MTESGFTTKGKQYFDDRVPIPSVTGILNDSWPKQLTKWAAETVAGYAVENWDELGEKGIAVRLRELEQSVWAKRDAAAMRGTEIHKHGEELALTGRTDVPDEHVGPVRAYADFLKAWDVKPLIVERPVLNRSRGYAGRPDLLALIEDERWLLDIKTGGNLFESMVLQQAGYANAEIYLDDDGQEREWPRPQRCGIVHILPDVAVLKPLTVDARAYRTFLYCAENAKYARDCRAAYTEGRHWPVGPALIPPGEKPHPMLEIVQ